MPLTFERFRVCELYAEVLHCSNMTILNRLPETGPKYDEQGRLLGGLKALEDLARVVSPGFSGDESPRGFEPPEDPAFALTESRAVPVAGDNGSVGSSDSSSTDDDGVSSVDVEDVLEDVHFDDEESPHEARKPNDSNSRPELAKASSSLPSHSTEKSSSRQLSDLSLTHAPSRRSPEISLPSPSSDKTVVKPESSTPISSPPQNLLSGDVMKQKFLDLNIVSTLLVSGGELADEYARGSDDTVIRTFSSSFPSITSSTTLFTTYCTRF